MGESRNYHTEALGDDGEYYSLNPHTEGTSFVRARFVHNGKEYTDLTPISVVPSTN